MPLSFPPLPTCGRKSPNSAKRFISGIGPALFGSLTVIIWTLGGLHGMNRTGILYVRAEAVCEA